MNREEFLKSQDFMKLGQAIQHGQWQVAGMTVQRMQRNAASIEGLSMDRNLIGIKQCIAMRNKVEAQNILAQLIAKRVKLLKEIQEQNKEDN